MKPAVKVQNLSKMYHVTQRQEGYRTLRESLADAVLAPWRGLNKWWSKPKSQEPTTARLEGETFWALSDVSFEVQPGEVVGIIGRNGAGKSTLLKVLSRITEPTKGRVELRGRVGSLLEVGTGFHHELTGRENIYMNGSILGMSRREIARKFDEIVDFAEVEDFLDTPVKRYSSGMFVKLAFAVAAHLEPEILIIDEVLAVGDQAFQQKCLRKMDAVRQHGRTILFVSHDMVAVQGICTRAVVLNKGRIGFVGDVTDGVKDYFKQMHALKMSGKHGEGFHGKVSLSHPNLKITDARVTANGEFSEIGFNIGVPLRFEFDVSADMELNSPVFMFRITRLAGPNVTTMQSRRAGATLPNAMRGDFTVTCEIRDLLLPAGEYLVQCSIRSDNKWIYVVDDAAMFTILPTDFFNSGMNPAMGNESVLCYQNWSWSEDRVGPASGGVAESASSLMQTPSP